MVRCNQLAFWPCKMTGAAASGIRPLLSGSAPTLPLRLRCQNSSSVIASSLAVAVMTLLMTSQGARSDNIPGPVPPNEQCSVPDNPDWTDQEKFVWQRVCAGKIADFNDGPSSGGDLGPKWPEEIPDKRILTSAFLETILLDKKYRKALTRLGVQIIGARFADTVELANAQLGHDLILRRCILDRGAHLVGLRSGYTLALNHSKINGTLDIGTAHVNQLSLTDSNVTEDLGMYGLRVDQTLYMQRAELQVLIWETGGLAGDST